MNCRPNDLAIVVTALGFSAVEDCIGKIFRLGKVVVNDRFGPAWSYVGPRQFARLGEIQYIADACLRPIRDPGDDARDETLSWLPVPSKEVA